MNQFTLTETFAATPIALYTAWVDPRDHAQFTGSAATGEARPGERFTSWDGYIEGRHLTLEPGKTIVQAWRTSEFPAGSADSMVTIELQAVAEGTLLTLHHTQIPEGQADRYCQGWIDYYFAPLHDWLARG